jgi:hypothetical protein
MALLHLMKFHSVAGERGESAELFAVDSEF